MIARVMLLAALLCAAGGASAAAQSRDSVPYWTHHLVHGSLPQRARAAHSLAGLDARSLPLETKAAFIHELNRINALRLAHEPVDGESEMPRETFDRYYIDLVATTVAFNSAASENAVVRAVAVSSGLQRRVARRGDIATPMLVEMIEREHEPGAALETLGLIWFHADSTGTPLSPTTRSTIVRHLLLSTGSPAFGVRRSAVLALRSTADPAFLPVAEHFARRAAAENDPVIGQAVQHEAVLPLRRRAWRTSVALLAARVARAGEAVCSEPGDAQRREACLAMRSALAGTGQGASNGGASLTRESGTAAAMALDRALAAGAFTESEHALLAGGLRMLAPRLR